MKTEAFDRIASQGVVPVIVLEDASRAIPLADALLEGGLSIIEITFRTPAAAEVIATLAKERPAMTVGAGTVLSEETLRVARDAGAAFAVAPGLNPAVVGAAREMGMPFVPGVATPSEIEQGLSFGLELLKFFPAGPMGGVKYLSAIFAAYRHTGVRFLPTGGISDAAAASEWLACPAVAAVGGSWVARAADIAAGRWDEISRLARAAASLRAATPDKTA